MPEKNMTTGIIFNIQRFSTHDGPGIRTVVFIKGCPLRCYWCQNPESQQVGPVLMHKRDLCTGCGSCLSVCPTGAMSLEGGKSAVDRKKCVGCGSCADVCPSQAAVISGYRASVEQVYGEIMKDRSYYMNSGGGVTLSGGEATAQPEFSLELLVRCKKSYLNTAVETCGYAAENVLRKFIPVTDLFLYDIKAVDSKLHEKGTGRGNEIIKSNVKMLLAEGCKVLIRMPLIPGYNDSCGSVLALRSFVTDELHLAPDNIELLKYNPLGEVKFERLGREDIPNMKPQSDEYFEKLKSLLH